MEKLKILLAGVVLLLAATLAYGLIAGGDNDEDPGRTTPAQAVSPPPETAPEPAPLPDSLSEPPKSPAPAPEDAPAGDAADPGPKPKREEGPKNGGEESAGAAPSRSEFVARADRICAKMPGKFERRAEDYERIAGESASPEELVRKVAAPVLVEAARAIGKLTPPAGQEGEVKKLVAALERVAKSLRESPALGVAEENSPLVEFGDLAQGFGLKRCSQF